MEVNLLPKRTLLLWQLRFGMIAVIILAAVSFLLFASPYFLILSAGIAVLFALLIFLYLPRYFRSYIIRFSEDAVMVNRGIFIKTTHIMPYPRLIYAESYTSPLAKQLGLSAVFLRAARSRLVIPEMRAQDAQLLISAISQGDKE